MEIYKDTNIDNFNNIRTFSESIDEIDLMWHRDLCDRYILSIEETDWMIQMDNQLPVQISTTNEFFIPKLVFHRLIKGKDNKELKIKIREEEN